VCSLLRPPLPQATLERVGVRGNTGDMDSQPFYRFIQRTYGWHVVAQFAALFLAGGLPAVVWGGALRAVWVYHITWFVNSASHVWGYQVRRLPHVAFRDLFRCGNSSTYVQLSSSQL